MLSNVCFIFCKTNRKPARTAKVILKDYCSAPAELVNFRKSTVQLLKELKLGKNTVL